MTTCRHVATDQPRRLDGQHLPDCDTLGCDGCAPCPERHCHGRHCGRHLDDQHPVTCPRCVGYVRDDLGLIGQMTGHRLDVEAQHRGVDSEAAMLTGPAADPQAWAYRALSATFGRVDAAYLEDCRDELHPLWVCGTWLMVWQEFLDHHESDERITLPDALDYLAGQLTYMAQRDEPDFDQFAGEVRACRGHLEAVMHDQAMGDPANIGCFDCKNVLERRLTTRGFEDVWTCRGCRRTYTYAEYNFALRAHLEAATQEAS